MFAGDGGTYAGDSNGYFDNYAQNYLAAGYQIVQIAWGKTYPGYDWEYSNVNTDDYAYSIRNAACRPATFLNYVRFGNGNPNVPIIWNATKGGMCGHGNSGGAGAMAYALAWYNAGAGGAASNGSGYLDKVVLENGPVFSDIFQGCEVHSGVNSQYTTICPPGSTQTGCNSWPGGGGNVFDYHLEYISRDAPAVELWSGTPAPACATQNTAQTTTAAEQTLWQQMSIVDFTSTTQPSFNYPVTAMSGWLCQSVTGQVNGQPVPMNNSAPEGELFFLQFAAQSDAGGFLSVNGVSACPNGPENVEKGVVTVNNVTFGPGSPYASQALINDMIGQSPANPSSSCKNMGVLRAQQN
jgi:hypothetical protein